MSTHEPVEELSYKLNDFLLEQEKSYSDTSQFISDMVTSLALVLSYHLYVLNTVLPAPIHDALKRDLVDLIVNPNPTSENVTEEDIDVYA